MDRFKVGKGETQGPEEFLKAFLDTEIKALWPKGWMQPRYTHTQPSNIPVDLLMRVSLVCWFLRVLLKESRRVHCPTAPLQQ
jgi:hypothetical protein